MNKQQPVSFTIKCQCSAYKNGMLINTKKKSKLSNLQLNHTNKTINILPLNSKDECITFQLKRLKHIHRKFINEGKITLEFTQEVQKSSILNSNREQTKTERLSQILVNSASPQNLQLLIKKIIDIKKQIQSQNMPLIKRQTLTQKQHKIQLQQKAPQSIIIKQRKTQPYPKIQKYTQTLIQRKKDPLQYNKKLKQYDQQERNKNKFSRKQLIKQALNPDVYSKKMIDTVPKNTLHHQVDILELPNILLTKIFEYTKVELRHRLINKKFDSFVLKNLKSLSFHDQIDQKTFNKLAKYTINVKGRLKNVRKIEFMDIYDDQQLEKNRSKSLYFGQWKQMSQKNMQQIKGLRVYLLQMPYQIKFPFQAIYGIRLKELHLMSRAEVTTQNLFFTNDSLIQLFKHVDQLEAFSIPYINSTVLEQLSTNLKHCAQRLKVLKIGSINENCKKQQSWWIMHIYSNLRKLQIQRVLKGGLPKSEAKYTFTFPMYLEQLSLGGVASRDTIENLPTTLTRLKLSSDQYYNNDIANIYLPYLRSLDLSECLMVRPSVIDLLQKCNNLKMTTNWEKQDIDQWKSMATEKGIQIFSIRGMIRK